MKFIIIVLIFLSGLSSCQSGHGARSARDNPIGKAVQPAKRDVYEYGIWDFVIHWKNLGRVSDWTGTMRIQRVGDIYLGEMHLSCVAVHWEVRQDVKVKIDGGKILIKGSNVREKSNEGRSGYGWDEFKLLEIDGLEFKGNAGGEHESKGIINAKIKLQL